MLGCGLCLHTSMYMYVPTGMYTLCIMYRAYDNSRTQDKIQSKLTNVQPKSPISSQMPTLKISNHKPCVYVHVRTNLYVFVRTCTYMYIYVCCVHVFHYAICIHIGRHHLYLVPVGLWRWVPACVGHGSGEHQHPGAHLQPPWSVWRDSHRHE